MANNARFRVESEYVELPSEEPDANYQGNIIRVRECGGNNTRAWP